ncbi:MAG: hypothetical protein HRT89_24145 [Lentisphaeria bacterium]|nr:hypothetical protein [Lentisphaeria bacterium]NQZ71150.1 hypothetical protein [Lentisphaeria bacterium]
MSNLSGITWDHRRGWGPLEMVQNSHNQSGASLSIDWMFQEQDQFGMIPVNEISEQCDIFFIHQSQIGQAASDGLILSIDDTYDHYVGQAFASCHWNEKLWALPVDMSCHVSACKDHESISRMNWDELLNIASPSQMGIALAGVNCLEVLFSLLVTGGNFLLLGQEFPLSGKVVDTLDLLKALKSEAHPDSINWYTRDVLDALSVGTIKFSPMVFGSIEYEINGIVYDDIPSYTGKKPHGVCSRVYAVAVSAHSKNQDEAIAFAKTMSSAAIQANEWLANGGQPASRNAWFKNMRKFSLFKNTLFTMDESFCRPTHNQWLDCQYDMFTELHDWLSKDSNDFFGIDKHLRECWAKLNQF